MSDLAAAAVMVRAHRAGQDAAREGRDITACPYDLNAADSREQAKARMWLRGYDKVNPFPVDYSG